MDLKMSYTPFQGAYFMCFNQRNKNSSLLVLECQWQKEEDILASAISRSNDWIICLYDTMPYTNVCWGSNGILSPTC